MSEETESFIQKCRNFKAGKIEREFRFDPGTLFYRVSDNTGGRTVSIAYENIGVKESKALTFKNRTYRPKVFLIYFLTVFSCFCFLAAFNQPIAMLCLLAVAIMAGIYLFFRTMGQYTHTVMESNHGKVYILHDAQHDKIFGLLTERWRLSLRALHGEINPLNSIARELEKFKSLRKHDIISEQEYQTAKSLLEQKLSRQSEPLLPGERSLN